MLADCYEAMGRLEQAVQLLERVVEMDRKFGLPKLEENTKRLAALRARLSADDLQHVRKESNA